MKISPIVLLLFAVLGCDSESRPVSLSDEEFALQKQSIAAIVKLGGKVRWDIIAVNTVVSVDLSGTKITDKGLEHLNGLTDLPRLFLSDTEVTDSGLEHLKKLTNLKLLSLHNTKVTDEGVQKLQTALPNCRISY